MDNASPFRTGYIAIVGRPNVGKSTLMNHLLGQKISITSHKPQTTRHRILGIKTEENYQCVYVDTPGLHLNAKKAMNRYLNRTASSSVEDVDLVLFMIEAGVWSEEDQSVLKRIKGVKAPIILVVNKIDRNPDREGLLPELKKLSGQYAFTDIVPVSALRGENVAQLEQCVVEHLPVMPPIFPEDQVTDRSERFLASEILREKLMRRLGNELPYAISVEIEQFKQDEEKDDLVHIGALIWVERNSQKRIVIGKGGTQLREIGKQARLDMQKLFGQRVFLQLWVKVKEGWSDNERSLNSLGYRDEL